MSLAVLIFFSAALLISTSHTAARAAGDSSSGEKLAKEHCARCHDIALGGAFKRYPPSFASIAAFRSEEQIYARIVFPSLHSGMPEVAFYLLQPQQIADLVAYITSLEKNSP
jgi:mono/diheme cytochrome c family protein